MSREVVLQELFPFTCRHGRVAYARFGHSALGPKKRLVIQLGRGAQARTVRARRRRIRVVRVNNRVAVRDEDGLELGLDGGVIFIIAAFEVVIILVRL